MVERALFDPELPVAVLRYGRSRLARAAMRLLRTDDVIPGQSRKSAFAETERNSIRLLLPWRSRRREDVTMHLPRATLEFEHEQLAV
jgi:hypothetical protein